MDKKPVNEMTDDEINHACATEVMGWEVSCSFSLCYYSGRMKNDDEFTTHTLSVDKFDPLHDFGQCGEMLAVVEKKLCTKIQTSFGLTLVRIYSYKHGELDTDMTKISEVDKSKERAICLACIEAARWLKEREG